MAFDGLVDYLKGTKEAWRPTINVFPEIDVAQLAKDLDLEVKGRAQKDASSVQHDGEGLDQVEREIVEDIRFRGRSARNEYFTSMELYEARLSEAAIGDAAFVKIKAHAEDGLADLKAQLAEDRLPLQAMDERAALVCREYDVFVARNRLADKAPQSSTFRNGMAWIVSLLVFESATNGVFFAAGSEMGLVGGFAEAIVLSLLNFALAGAMGGYALRYVRHVSIAQKLTAMAAIATLALLTLGLNLLIAHYRQAYSVSGGHAVDFGAVLRTVRASPLELGDAKSWILGILGIWLNIFAAFKFYRMFDPYPGFGRLAKRKDDAINALIDMQRDCINDLAQHRNVAVDRMRESIELLEARRRDFEVALRGRKRRFDSFNEYVDALDSACIRLGMIYRQATDDAGQKPPLASGVAKEEFMPDAYQVDGGAHTRAIETMSGYLSSIADEYGQAVEKVSRFQLAEARHAATA